MRWLILAVFAMTFCGVGQVPLPGQTDKPKDVETKPALTGKAGSFTGVQLKSADRERTFRLKVPDSYDGSKPCPLLFDLHGLGANGDIEARFTGLEAAASKRGYIVITPTAEKGRWNINQRQDNPDLAFFDDMLGAVKGKYAVDAKRVYVTGMSMGGFMSNFLVSTRSDVLAAAAPHSGGLGRLAAGINAAQKVPVMVIHGDADTVVRIEQGRQARDRYQKEGHEVKYVEIAGLGHRWASGEKINDQILDFFDAHPKKKGE